MNAKDFNSGDVIVITSKSKVEEHSRIAVVVAVSTQYVQYNPYYGDLNVDKETGSRIYAESGCGSFCIADVGAHSFGVHKVEVIGRASEIRHWYPKPGDTGYDLLC